MSESQDSMQDERREAPSILDMVGILGDEWTGGLGSVDFVRQQREGK